MIDHSISNNRAMAKQVIAACDDLTYAEGQFLGGMAYSVRKLSEKQEAWLRDLYIRHATPAK